MDSLASSTAATSGELFTAAGAGGLLAGQPGELLAALPWGVLVLAPGGTVSYLNAAAAVLWGVPAAAIAGHAPAQVQPAVLPPTLLEALAQPDAAPAACWLPHTQQWVKQRVAPAPDGQRWVFWDNVTAQHQAEAARQRSSQLLLDMEAVAHTGSYEADLTTGSFYFSDGLYQLFGEAPQAFEVTLAAIDARSHPADVATVRRVLDEAVRTRQPYSYRRRIRRADGAWRTLEAHGEVRADAAGHPSQLRGLVQDVTERVQAEAALHENRELLRATIDSSLDMVQVFEAVRDAQGAVEDFTWVLNNDAAERVYGDVIGQRLCQLNPGVVTEGIFDTFKKVLETGVPDQREHHYVHEQFDGWFYQSTVKLGDGVTTTTHDITARKRAEQALRDSQTLLQDIIDAPHIGLAVYRAVRNEAGDVVDFTHEYINRASQEMLGEDFTGRLFSDHGENGQLQLAQLREVLATGHRNGYLREADFRGRRVWFAITNTPLDADRLVHTWEDVTERKQAEAEIIQLKEEIAQQATDKYHALFQRLNQGFCVLKILFDEAGQQAVGFKPLEVNQQFAQESGMAAYTAGNTPRELVPALDEFWLAAYGQIVRTGEAQRLERYEPKVSRWFEVHAFRIGPPAAHQVAVLFSDISARKQAEQRQQYVMQLTDALRPLADPLAIQREALGVLRAHLGGTRTLYAEARDQEGTMYISTEDRDAGLVPMEGLVMRFQDFTPDGLAEAKAGRPLWRRDVLIEPHTPEQLAGYAAFGTRAWLMVPLVKNGRLMADLTVHSATARAWTTYDIALVQETTERTWAAVERARAEVALRESEEKLRTVFDSIDEGFCLAEIVRDGAGAAVDYRLLEVNRVFERQTGLANARGRLASEFAPGEEAFWLESYDRVARTGEPARLENYHQVTQRWYSAFAARIGSEGSSRVAIVFSDISERKRREANLSLLAEVSEDLVRLTDVDATMNALGAKLAAHLGLSACAFAELTDAAQTGIIRHEWRRAGLPSLLGTYRMAEFVAPEVLRRCQAGEAVVIRDVWADPLTDGAQYAALQVGSFVSMPLVRGGEWRFLLVVYRPDAYDWTPDEVDLLREVTGRIWTRLERARAEEALRASEEKYRTLFETIDEGFAMVEVLPDEHGRVADLVWREANPGVERHAGMGGWVGKRASEIVPNLEQDWLDALTGVYQTGAPVRMEAYNADLNRWIDTYYARIGSAGSPLVAAVFNNITERKQHEQRQAFLLHFSDALRAEPTADAVALRALHLLSEQLQLDRCYTAEYHLEADHAAIPHQVGNDRVPPLPADGIRLSDFPEAFRVVFDQTLVIDDVAETAGLSATDRRNIGVLGLRALVATTLRQGPHRPHWVIVAVSATPRPWTPAEIALLEDVTERTWAAMERAKIEEALRASEASLAAIFEALPLGVGLSDARGRLTLANHQMRRYLPTGLMPSRDELPQQQRWYAERPDGSPLPPTEFPGARAQRGEKVVPGVEMLHTPAEGPPVWTQVFAVPLQHRPGQVAGHVTVILDIDAHKRAEASLRAAAEAQAFRLQLADALGPLADAVAIQEAVTHLARLHFGADRCYYCEIEHGQAIIRHDAAAEGLPSVAGTYPLADFALLQAVIEAGRPFIVRDVRADESVDDNLRQLCVQLHVISYLDVPVIKNGQPVGVLCLVQSVPREWTAAETDLAAEAAERIWVALERAHAEEALAASEQRLRALIANLPGAAAFVVGPDLRYQLAGGEALDAAGLGPADLVGSTVAEAMPPALVPQYEAHYRQALAGQDFSLEHTAHGRTFVSRGVPLLGAAGQPEAVLVVSYDITARKQAEEALRASEAQLAELNAQLEQRVARRTQQLQTNRDLLQSVLDTSLISMSVLYAVRDEAGQVQDFRIGLVNKELARETGRTDLVSRLYAEEYPGIRQVGIFDLMLRTLATGQPQGMEYFYEHEGFKNWFACQFVKLGADGLVATNLDITERKTAEQERLRNLRLLQQAEAMAGLGSWDYDLATSTMRWSEGMYQLVNLPLGQPVSPDIYLQLVVDDDRSRAEQLVRRLIAGKSVQETLRLRVGDQLKTVRLQAVVLRDEASRPVRVLGVDLDISELQRLEADNLRLRLGQQQALFEAVQEAQEAERKRMAESLHNGIGQILYATKLRLDRLHAPLLGILPELVAARLEADQLLGEAIRQTRALSHELVPTTLQEFGLAAALQDICRKMSTPQLRLHCHVALDADAAPLPPALQMALYRMAQELAQNIAKHARGASAASLELETMPGWVLLRAEDNGPGFAPNATDNPGLGLRSIRDRVALLDGRLKTGSAPTGGAYVRIRIPLPTPAL